MSDRPLPTGFTTFSKGLIRLTPYLDEKHLRWLIAGLSFANERERGFWPSQSKIAALAGCRRQWANRVGGELVDLGVITRQERFDEKTGEQQTSVFRLSDLDDEQVYREIEAKCRAAKYGLGSSRAATDSSEDEAGVSPAETPPGVLPVRTPPVSPVETPPVFLGKTPPCLTKVGHEETSLRDNGKRQEEETDRGATSSPASGAYPSPLQDEAGGCPLREALPQQNGVEQQQPLGQTTLARAADSINSVGSNSGGLPASTSSDQAGTTSSKQGTDEQASAQASIESGSVQTSGTKAKRKARGGQSSRGPAKVVMDEATKVRVRQLACKSLDHMTAYLRFGQAGIEAIEAGETWPHGYKTPESVASSSMDWRQFVPRNEAGDAGLADEHGVPLGIENWTAPAFAGFYWNCVNWHLAKQGRPIRHADDLGKLFKTMSNLIASSTKWELHRRIVQLISDFDEIMACKWKFGELPGESTLNNSLVSEAHAQWKGMSDMEKWEVKQRLEARAEAA